MAFGYKVPNFNLWGRVYRINSNGPTFAERVYTGPFYTPCAIAKDINNFAMHVQFPKWSALRAYNQTVFYHGDLFQIAGWEIAVGIINYVHDVGAGYPNEHRVATVNWWDDPSWDGAFGQFVGACSTILQPPPGAMMLGTTPPADGWETPQEVTDHS